MNEHLLCIKGNFVLLYKKIQINCMIFTFCKNLMIWTIHPKLVKDSNKLLQNIIDICLLAIFMVRVPFFGHKTQGLHCCYLPNYTWNQFNCESFDNSYGGGNFSHAYVITHQYFGKNPKMKKMNR